MYVCILQLISNIAAIENLDGGSPITKYLKAIAVT